MNGDLMAKYKVTIDKVTCIGCGLCASICPDVFELGEDVKARIVEAHRTFNDDVKAEGVVKEALSNCVKDAESSCPTTSITVKEE